jgi:hypothetical protein
MSATLQEPTNNGTGLVPVHSSPALLRPVATPAKVIEAHKEAVALIEQALEQDRDYGVIPGTGNKPTLLKPGAERLLISFGLYAEAHIVEQQVEHDKSNVFSFKKWVDQPTEPSRADKDRLKAMGLGRNRKTDSGWKWQTSELEEGTSFGLYRYVVRTDLKLRTTGETVGTGIGSCSTLESKYMRAPRDYENTVLKMAKKRSLIDATLSTLGLSERFTQDVEDLKEVIQAERGEDVKPEPAPVKSAALAPEVRAWLEGLKLSPNELSVCKAYAKEADILFTALATEAHGEQVTTKDEFTSYCIDASRMAVQRRKDKEKAAPAAEVVEAHLVPEDAKDPYADDEENDEPALEVVEGKLVNTETGEVKETAGEAATVAENPTAAASSADPFFDGEYHLTPDQRRKVIGIVRGTGITMEDVLTVGKAEGATTIEEVIKIAEREAGGAK